MDEHVSHPGVIKNITDETLEIEILSSSSCGSCGIKSACGMSDMQEKLVTVPKPVGREFSVGQPVSIVMSVRMGNMAAFIAYFVPTFIILTLTGVLGSMVKDWVAGLIGIGSLAIYYAVLYSVRDRLKNKFVYEIR